MCFIYIEETDIDGFQQVGCLANVFSGADITNDVTRIVLKNYWPVSMVHVTDRICVLSSLGHTVCLIHGKSEAIMSHPRSTPTDYNMHNAGIVLLKFRA